jgi:hypothetical protein
LYTASFSAADKLRIARNWAWVFLFLEHAAFWHVFMDGKVYGLALSVMIGTNMMGIIQQMGFGGLRCSGWHGVKVPWKGAALLYVLERFKGAVAARGGARTCYPTACQLLWGHFWELLSFKRGVDCFHLGSSTSTIVVGHLMQGLCALVEGRR